MGQIETASYSGCYTVIFPTYHLYTGFLLVHCLSSIKELLRVLFHTVIVEYHYCRTDAGNSHCTKNRNLENQNLGGDSSIEQERWEEIDRLDDVAGNFHLTKNSNPDGVLGNSKMKRKDENR